MYNSYPSDLIITGINDTIEQKKKLHRIDATIEDQVGFGLGVIIGKFLNIESPSK